MSRYPRDEFDQVPESAARQGVHRERLEPPRASGLALKIIVGLLVLAIGLAAYFVFPRLGIGLVADVTSSTSGSPPSSDETPASDEPSAQEETSAPEEATASAEPSDAASPSPSAAPSESPSAEPTSAEPEPSAVDRTQPVAVLNGTTVAGLASTAAGRLQAEGWNVSQIGNWTGQPPQQSLILYNGEEQRASAEELARVLGVAAVQGDAGVPQGITVVVGPGFQ